MAESDTRFDGLTGKAIADIIRAEERETIRAEETARLEAQYRAQQEDTNQWIKELADKIAGNSAATANAITNGFGIFMNQHASRTERVGNPPAKFKGVKSDAKRFLTQLRSHFRANASIYMNDAKKMTLAFGLLEDKAGEWGQPYLETLLDADERQFKIDNLPDGISNEEAANLTAFIDTGYHINKDYLLTTWENFEDAFQGAWFSANATADARNAIEKLIQGTGLVSDYATKFSLVASETGYSKTDLTERFRRGLHINILRVISGWDRDMSEYAKLRDAALQAERNQEEFLGRKSVYAAPNTGSWRSPNNTKSTPAQNTSTSSNHQASQGIAPMEVDAGEIVCYNCYQKGHMRGQCTNEAQPFRQVRRKGAPPAKKVAASEVAQGKKPEFEQGASTDGKTSGEGPSGSNTVDLRKQIDEMQIQMGLLMSKLSAQQDF